MHGEVEYTKYSIVAEVKSGEDYNGKEVWNEFQGQYIFHCPESQAKEI